MTVLFAVFYDRAICGAGGLQNGHSADPTGTFTTRELSSVPKLILHGVGGENLIKNVN